MFTAGAFAGRRLLRDEASLEDTFVEEIEREEIEREREEIERELQLPTQEFGRSDAALCKHGPPSGAGR